MKLKSNVSLRVSLLTACVASLSAYSAHAMAAQNSLEESLFGGGDTPTSGAPAPTTPSTPVPKTSPNSSTSEAPKQTTTNEQLTLGGRLELQSLVNKNRNQNLGDARLLNTATAELYLDSRPTDDLRGFVKGAISNAAPGQSAPTISIYETWIKWSGRDTVFTTLGKQKLKWGAATFWNPTDFFAVQPKDPFAPFDVRPGANLLKVHVPLEKLGHNFYALANLENTSAAHDPKLAARAEFNFGLGDVNGELTTTVAGGRNQPQQYGVDLNTGLGPIDLVIESAFTRKSNKDFFRRETAADGSPSVVAFSRSGETITQVVGGLRYDLKYSESDSANLSVEYFKNDFGTDDPVIEAVSFLRGQSQRLYLSNRYLAANLLLPQPGPLNDSTLLVSGLWNMADKSWLARASWTERFNVKSSVILAVSRTGGLGEMTGGIPTKVADELRKAPQTSDVSKVLGQFEGIAQEWTISATAGIEL